jgi:hypothetical protein
LRYHSMMTPVLRDHRSAPEVALGSWPHRGLFLMDRDVPTPC